MTVTAARIRATLLAAALFGAGGYAMTQLQISTAITHFLPEGETRELAVLATLISDSELTKMIVLSVGAPDATTASRAAGALADRLDGNPEVAWIRAGVDPGLSDAVRALYFPRRLRFLSDRPEETLPDRLTDAGLRAEAAEIKRRLSMPDAALVKAVAPSDPLLGFVAQLDRLKQARVGELDLVDGHFVSGDGKHGIVFLGTSGSPFASGPMRQLIADVNQAFAAVQAEIGAELSLEQSGVHRFAIESEKTIKGDITRISAVSTMGLLLLFGLLFRSPRYVLLTFVPVVAGVAGAIIATTLLYESVHGLTLAFGSALIGVSVDYAIHLVNHHALAGQHGPQRSLATVWPGLLLGGLTTIAGLAGLAWTSFPGIREIAVFATVGVGSALMATRWVVTPWLPPSPTPVPLSLRVARALGAALGRMRQNRSALAVAWGAATIMMAVGLPRLAWVDALSALNHLPPDVLDEDNRVRARVSRMEGGQFVVAFGSNTEEALRGNDRLFHLMAEAQAAGEIDGYRSLHSVLWSQRLQDANLNALAAAPDLLTRLDAAFVAEGFRAGSFTGFGEAIAAPAAPLTFEDLMASGLSTLVRPFRVNIDGKVGILTFLRGVRDPGALAARVSAIPDALFFDQNAFMTKAYGDYRVRTLELVAAGLLAVLSMVWIRYRRLRLALAAFLPALFAAVATLGLLGLLGMQANLMHLVALLLILSIGVDYGVFMVEHRSMAEGLSATFLSIVVACGTTMLSFGLLAMSSNPALRALGTAVGAGVFFALLLAPTALILVGDVEAKP